MLNYNSVAARGFLFIPFPRTTIIVYSKVKDSQATKRSGKVKNHGEIIKTEIFCKNLKNTK